MSEQERVLWVGHNARDDAALESIQESGARLYVIGEHLNPGLVEKAEQSGGEFYKTPDITNKEITAAYAEDVGATLTVVTGEAPLAVGTIDTLRQHRPDMLTVGPNAYFARLESDKEFGRWVIDQIDPTLNPLRMTAKTPDEIDEVIRRFMALGKGVAIKPIKPAGGRGVMVMGKNLKDYEAATAYAKDVITWKNQENGVLIEEALEGIEFNLNIITDGSVFIAPPVTQDFPYRRDGDTGQPTGGMGSVAFRLSDLGELPAYLTAEDYQRAVQVTKQIVQFVQTQYAAEVGDGQHVSGVIYPNFIMTKDGLRIIEINMRPGDPEWMNINGLFVPGMDALNMYKRQATAELRPQDVQFQDKATVVIYCVPPAYAEKYEAPPTEFMVNEHELTKRGVKLYWASAERYGDHYRSVKTSRPLALVRAADTPWEARAAILEAKQAAGLNNLEHRDEIGKEKYHRAQMDPRLAA